MNFENLNVKIFADGADKQGMLSMYRAAHIQGLTTNPTLMRKAGVKDYSEFCIDILKNIKSKPISFEVFSDDFEEMYTQALTISSWAENVYVKIPVTNTQGKSSIGLIKRLVEHGVKLNVTAIMTLEQVNSVAAALSREVPSYISIFAGRIADTGRDPIPTMVEALRIIDDNKKCELIWASPREILNIVQADSIGCHIITVTNDLLNKSKTLGYDLDRFSLDTVKMFRNDAVEAGYNI